VCRLGRLGFQAIIKSHLKEGFTRVSNAWRRNQSQLGSNLKDQTEARLWLNMGHERGRFSEELFLKHTFFVQIIEKLYMTLPGRDLLLDFSVDGKKSCFHTIIFLGE